MEDLEIKEKEAVALAVRIAVNHIAMNMDAADSEHNRKVLKEARELGNNYKILVPTSA